MSDANHLRKHKFFFNGFKRSWFVICDWWISIRFVTFCVLNIVVKAAWELQRSRVCETPSDLHQQSTYCNGLPNKTINVTTHIVWIIIHFTHKRDFYTHEQTRTWVYLKASLVPTKHKPIPFMFIRQFLNVFVLFLLILLGCKSQIVAQDLLTFSASQNKIAQSYYDQNPTLIFQIFLLDFIPGLQTSKVRWSKNTEDSD